MKGIVVEIKKHAAAVLSEEGCVVKVSNHNYQIGQEVDISMKKQIKFKKVFAFASAAACILAISGISAYAYYTPYTYVSLDVNPSIEYSVNRFEKVLSVKGVNDDGAEIINDINLENLKNKSIEDAISLTVDEISNAGYFDSNTGGIVITTSSDNMTTAGTLAQTLETIANNSVEKSNHEAIVTAEAVGANRVAEAKELGVTPGKLNLVEKLMESADDSDNINTDEWLHKSVKDIMAKTNEYKEQSQENVQNSGKELQSQDQNANEEKNGKTNGQSETSGIGKSDTDNSSSNTNNSNVGNNSGTNSNSNAGNNSGANRSNSNAGNNSGTNSNSNAGNSSGANNNSNAGNSSGANNNSNAGNNSKSDNGSNKKGN